MSREPAPSLIRHALVPLSLVVCFSLVYLAGSPIIVAVIVGGALLALYLAAPTIGRRSLAAFDREAVRRLAQHRPDTLGSLYARAWGMRLFASPARVAERRGLAAAQAGDHTGARAAYDEAVALYPEGEAPLAVIVGAAHAAYALGQDESAIDLYGQVLAREPSFPKVARRLAHALARSGERLDRAEPRVERALSVAGDGADPELLLSAARVSAA
ncbi:MAG: tetratricopeptide repeat protein, partial [Sandaracinaceae bacterium]